MAEPVLARIHLAWLCAIVPESDLVYADDSSAGRPTVLSNQPKEKPMNIRTRATVIVSIFRQRKASFGSGGHSARTADRAHE